MRAAGHPRSGLGAWGESGSEGPPGKLRDRGSSLGSCGRLKLELGWWGCGGRSGKTSVASRDEPRRVPTPQVFAQGQTQGFPLPTPIWSLRQLFQERAGGWVFVWAAPDMVWNT